MSETKHITVTKTVPVDDRATLADWLDQELAGWLKDGKRDAGTSKATAGHKALDLIEEAGFKIVSPSRKRHADD